MKKIICLLLCFWLPLFFSVASYASTHMVSANVVSTNMQMAETVSPAEAAAPSGPAEILIAAPMMQAENKMPDDCPMGNGGASGDMTDHGTQDKTSHDKCQHCGFCAAMAFYLVAAIVDGSAPYRLLGGYAAWAPSFHLPIADQRPPITL